MTDSLTKPSDPERLSGEATKLIEHLELLNAELREKAALWDKGVAEIQHELREVIKTANKTREEFNSPNDHMISVATGLRFALNQLGAEEAPDGLGAKGE